ncbi:FO synthase, subunit 2-like protein [Candidatus Desulfofervidus auxilii]|uniref:Aminodeoxyfutalosine synthase n=1 Tax=Desulfofervidus auxilii TaxID=1621989 RepID=A0A7U4TH38_DESA2|nr:aminofutalosine synthase MqnE [Candidatus Desulfofervidus auxilii]AMM39828.1 FO synthase, subunit 2-like protein [Candidatus Desulfofervidus auxilii]
MESEIEEIAKKIEKGERLSLEEGLRLYDAPLLTIGELAKKVKERLHGKKVYYVYNQHINYSNICKNLCKFCAFGKPKGDPQGFTLTLEEIEQKIKARLDEPIKEIHIVGSVQPDLPFDYYVELIKLVHSLRPEAIIKAYTITEIAHFTEISGKNTEQVLRILKEAGVQVLPGGGAEIFAQRVRQKICPRKISGEKWLNIAQIAHRSGIPTNCTMLFGHIETKKERLEHLIALRELQDETKGFICFIPLCFHPQNTKLSHLPGPSGVDILKTMAISRIMLDNIPHIKAYWVMLTPKLAQVALNFGADDLDGTIIEEKITHMAEAQSPQALTRAELESLIRETGYKPIERDTFFREIN